MVENAPSTHVILDQRGEYFRGYPDPSDVDEHRMLVIVCLYGDGPDTNFVLD